MKPPERTGYRTLSEQRTASLTFAQRWQAMSDPQPPLPSGHHESAQMFPSAKGSRCGQMHPSARAPGSFGPEGLIAGAKGGSSRFALLGHHFVRRRPSSHWRASGTCFANRDDFSGHAEPGSRRRAGPALAHRRGQRRQSNDLNGKLEKEADRGSVTPLRYTRAHSRGRW